jgi:DNA-binding transcriptional LysR family regulator
MIDTSLAALEAFVAVADELHFTRAAARLHVAQPALTKRIQQLERDLQVRVFERDRRAVRLTPEGEMLLPKARQILGGAHDLLATARQLRRGDVGRLRIGFTPSAPYHLLPSIMRAFRRAHAGIECVLSEASSEEQLDQLAAGGLDVGILRPPRDCPASIVCETFLEEPFVAVLPRGHRLLARRTVSLRDLSAEPFVLVARRVVTLVYDQILSACNAAGFTPRIVQEGSQIHAVAGLVAAGCGVSVLPESVTRLRFPNVQYRPLRQTTLSTVMAVAHRRDASSSVLGFVVQVRQLAWVEKGRIERR